MAKNLKLLTLNAWAIALPWPFGSKDRSVRVDAIADALANGDHDIVALQEIWSVEDYDIIRKRVASKLPDSFYFHSGMIGSGICIFTKGTITQTMMHRYSLNGYPHHVHRGDWFGGKVVGLARIAYNGLKIDVYSTHLHAEYDKVNDLYLPHRVSQAYELTQFINGTSRGDLAIVMGDLNLEPIDFGYQLIMETASLNDAYVVSRNLNGQINNANPLDGMTCEVPTNSYVSPESLKVWPHGKRIDYILYRANENVRITSRECQTALGRIPEKQAINYSDHEAISATLEIAPDGVKPDVITPEFPEKAIRIVEDGIAASRFNRHFFAFVFGLLVVLFFATINVEVTHENRLITLVALVARFALTLGIGFTFIHGLVGLKMEQKSLEAAKSGMLVLRKAKKAE